MFAKGKTPKGIRRKALILEKPINPTVPTKFKPYHKHIIYGKNSKVVPFDVRTNVQREIIIDVFKELIPRVDEEILDQVQRIVVEKSPGDGLIGGFDLNSGWLYVYPDGNLTKQDYRDTIIHELHHAWYLKASREDPKKVKEYNEKLDLLPPLTHYARKYYDAWKEVQIALQRGEVKSKKELDEYTKAMKDLEEAYHDEMHSETGEFIESNQKEKKEMEILNPDVMKMAIKLYKQLHG